MFDFSTMMLQFYTITLFLTVNIIKKGKNFETTFFNDKHAVKDWGTLKNG
jgi:hypothetical protein